MSVFLNLESVKIFMTKNTIKKASLKFNYMAITQRPTEKTEVLSQNFQLLC